MNHLPPHQQSLLWISATRYAIGRRTYIVGETCDLLIQEWENIPEDAKRIIQKDLETEFERDDYSRSLEGISSTTPYPLGMDCDRQDWERVRKLWKKDHEPHLS